MKKANYLFLSMMFVLSALFFNSCNKDEVEIIDEQSIRIDNVNQKRTKCNILGNSTVSANSNGTYTYTSNISNPNITWTVISGNISILSGQGTATVTVHFGNNFTTGVIGAHGQNGFIECSEVLNISTGNPDTCPDDSDINILHAADDGNCKDFSINLQNANDVASVTWEYSIGPYSHVYFGSSSNPNGNYSITIPLYLPTGSWDNYELQIFANITLNDGTTCNIWNKRTLSCPIGSDPDYDY